MYNKTLTNMMNNYYKPTPKKWRKIGDALLGVSTMITSFSIYENIQWLAISALMTGVVGKFLTNFFSKN
mgnify:CR=1 FL=1